MTSIREPAVAGQFYPADKVELQQMVAACLAQVKAVQPVPKAIIAPHAGFIYSGPIAATAYACLRAVSDKIKKVVLLGPAHTVGFHGLAVSSADKFHTPLGDVVIDRELQAKALSFPQVQEFDDAHTREHSLEVQLPFLQTLLDDFIVLPIVVGNAIPAKVSEVLEALWGGDETLIVISSDLSHYHDYQTAQRMDKATSAAIQQLNYQALGFESACGRNPIKGLLHLAQKKGLQARILDLRNSGDTAGPKDRVVGYGAYHFMEGGVNTKRYGQQLLATARSAIDYYLEHNAMPGIDMANVPDALKVTGAAFVTLEKGGQLRGCIGSLQAVQPLIVDVAQNACKAAFSDPRFPPLTAQEKDQIELSVSVLSPPAPMQFSSEAELINKLRPGIDGLILKYGSQRGTFLPIVWNSIPEPKEFLRHLKQKAGLPADFWSDSIEVLRYTTELIK